MLYRKHSAGQVGKGGQVVYNNNNLANYTGCKAEYRKWCNKGMYNIMAQWKL